MVTQWVGYAVGSPSSMRHAWRSHGSCDPQPGTARPTECAPEHCGDRFLIVPPFAVLTSARSHSSQSPQAFPSALPVGLPPARQSPGRALHRVQSRRDPHQHPGRPAPTKSHFARRSARHQLNQRASCTPRCGALHPLTVLYAGGSPWRRLSRSQARTAWWWQLAWPWQAAHPAGSYR